MSLFTRRLTTLAIGAFALIVTSACAVYAQGRPVPRGQATINQRAAQAQFESGYRDGLRAGESDVRRNERFNFRDEREWQRAGNNRPFRDGFERGYEDGYRRYDARGGYGSRGGYGNSGGGYDPRGGYGSRGGYGGRIYANPAMAAGYDDGYEQGMEDARDGDRYDPVRAKDYRDGDNGYDRRFGTRDQWKIAYRDGFKAGYDRGYREARQYGWR